MKKNKTCRKGYGCGGSCISVTYACRKEFPEGVSVSIDGARKVILGSPPAPVNDELLGAGLEDVFGDIMIDTMENLLDDIDNHKEVKPLSKSDTEAEMAKWARDRDLEPFLGQPGQQHDTAHILIHRMTGTTSDRLAGITQLKDNNPQFDPRGPGLFEEALVLAFEQGIVKQVRDTGKMDVDKSYRLFSNMVNNLGDSVATGLNMNYKQDALKAGEKIIKKMGKNPYLKDYVNLYGDLIYETGDIFS